MDLVNLLTARTVYQAHKTAWGRAGVVLNFPHNAPCQVVFDVRSFKLQIQIQIVRKNMFLKSISSWAVTNAPLWWGC